MGTLRHIAIAIPILMTTTTAACAGSDAPVVRVGAQVITKTMLEERLQAIKAVQGTLDRSSKPQAVDFLIHCQWMILEAAQLGIDISRQQVRARRDAVELAAFPGGDAELRQVVSATRPVLAQFELQARAQVAAQDLRQIAEDGAPAVSAEEVATYYARHRQRFYVPEWRLAQIAKRKTKVAAQRFRGEVQAGVSLITPAVRKVGEGWLTASTPPGHRNAVEEKIYTARPHVLEGPMKLWADYILLRVTKVRPPAYKTFAQVRRDIAAKLRQQHRQQALSAFAIAWWSRWLARTTCLGGYVVQTCRNYRGVRNPDAVSSFS